MRTITDDDGNVYVLKSDMETAIKDRISKVTQKAREYETQLQEAQEQISQLSKEQTNIDILTAKISDLESNLKKSGSQFERYKAISKHGLVDDDIIEAIEWAYEKSMSKTEEKNHVDLGVWLDNQIQDIDNAHPLLRPHLTQTTTQEAIEQPLNGQQVQQPPQTKQTPSKPIPRVNTGAQKAPETRDSLISKGLADPDFYRAHHKEIKQAIAKEIKGVRHG